jgi:hypothetical protein
MCWSLGMSSQSKQHIVSPVKKRLPVDSWNRCYDFLNIFAEKFGEKIGVFDFLSENYSLEKMNTTDQVGVDLLQVGQ